jgi:UDP-N-acetyl-D-glucosamine/UDP-N-acetyl-D-galactosamine dehydrogenase
MYNIAIIGLGYVGLPLAVEFGKQFPTIGFDINSKRVNELKLGIDFTLETTKDEISEANKLSFTDQLADISSATIFIVTVPTPIDQNKRPDLGPLEKSSAAIASVLKKGDIVIYESTVYPGCTEEICVPILEAKSGLVFNQDFFCGYSPERINPGDKDRRVANILKVTSGSTPAIADQVDALYQTIITAGTYKATSLKVAEAAKVIENCQRDLNISFVNELALIFERIGIDTNEVIEAAGTKWNFMKYRPGLVGGHCIGVDPYYLVHKAEQLGYYPEVILSGRRVNEQIGAFVANKVIKLMIKKGITIKDAPVLVLGITFKENCPDIRNSRVIDIIAELQGFGCQVEIYDPWANPEEVMHEYGVTITNTLSNQKFSAAVLAVAHNEFLTLDYSHLLAENRVLFDVKAILPLEMVDARL